ncbi:MAG: hypothetical protein ACUVRJ_06215 [Candidatus Villigracilaceae bacterium]
MDFRVLGARAGGLRAGDTRQGRTPGFARQGLKSLATGGEVHRSGLQGEFVITPAQ